MLEEASHSLPSMWDSVNSWFTPTVLFVFLNLMICTIAVTSSTLATHKPQSNGSETHKPRPLLHDLDSISSQSSQQPVSVLRKPPESNLHFSFKQSDEPQEEQPRLDRSPLVSLRMKSFNLDDYFSPDINPPNLYSPGEEQVGFDFEQSGRVEDKQTSDEIYSHSYVSGDIPVRAPRKMRKSASSKSAFTQFVRDDMGENESCRAESVKERKAKPMVVDEEVDAKADDFINKFKHQLKLQRIDSIIRYKEMISRGNQKLHSQSLS